MISRASGARGYLMDCPEIHSPDLRWLNDFEKCGHYSWPYLAVLLTMLHRRLKGKSLNNSPEPETRKTFTHYSQAVSN